MQLRGNILAQQVTSARRTARAFTLAEMLVVLAIIALLAALALPAIRGNTESVAIRAAAYQLVEDLSFARQKAISQRSTVAVVFLTDAISGLSSPNKNENDEILRLQAGIYTHYAIYGFRKVGEQPGRSSTNYLTEWKSLPEKTFFPTNDAYRGHTLLQLLSARFPFPFAGSANIVQLPYIAFDHQGQLVEITDIQTGRGRPFLEIKDAITNSIARGAVFYGRNNLGALTAFELQEIPPGNGMDNRVVVDAVTGRAKREELGVQ